MKKLLILSAVLVVAFSLNAQPRRPVEIVSKAGKTTVEFVVRDGKPVLMDIYQYNSGKTEEKRPVFIYSFGGAWAMGSRVDPLCNPLYDHLCEKGWVCVAIDYRLGSARGRDGKPLVTPPEGYNPFQYSIDIGVEDLYAATAWLIAHAEEYNIDPDKIVISGSSAGAINSMNAEYYISTGHRLAKENLPAGFNYAGVVPMAGAVYLTGENDTELRWGGKPCPMCFFHGAADPTVTFDVESGPTRHGFGPAYISKQLDEMDIPYMLNEYAGGDHVMALLPLKWFWNEIDSFLDRVVLDGQNVKVHAVETSPKPRTDANWLATVRSAPRASAQPEKIRLYEGKAPGSENWTQQEYLFEYTTSFNPGEVGECILNVVDPELWAYLPAPGTETGAAVVVCPGGGFTALSWHQEGPNVAKWFAAHGIAAFVLKYRTAFSGGDYEEAKYVADHSYGNQGRDARMRELTEKHVKIAEEQGYDRKMAWDDARVAITYIRTNAEKYGVNPKAIGIIGFSAGGNIVYHVALDHDEMSRPDFLGMIYPAWFEDQVPDDPMPLFIAASTGEASSANGFGDTPALYNAWNKTRQPLEIHSFTRGFHGFGYRENGQSVNIWTTLFYDFLDNCKLLNR